MSYLTSLVEGLAQLLADANIGLSWQTTGVYSAGTTGIFVMKVPQSPDRLVALTPAPMSASPSLSDSMVNLQVVSRSAGADPRDVLTLDDGVQDVLLGNYPLTLPSGMHVETLQYVGGGSLGQDDNLRWEWSSRYQLLVHRPGPHRR